MSTPGGVWELPTSQWCYTEMLLHAAKGKGRKRQNACSTEATEAVYPEPDPRADQSAMELVGY